MYSSDLLAKQIRLEAKAQNISQKELLTKSGLGINTISKLSQGNDILVKNLIKIADTLNCSVDYLIGRKIDKETSNFNLSQEEVILIKQFRKISYDDKNEILTLLKLKIDRVNERGKKSLNSLNDSIA